MNLIEAIKTASFNDEELYLKIGKVIEIDEAKRTCHVKPIDDTATIFDVNLQANQESETGLIIFPELESYVIVGFLNPDSAAILLTDKIQRVEVAIGDSHLNVSPEEVQLTVGESSLTMSSEKILLNGDTLGGMVVAEQVESNLNMIKDYCKNLNIEIATALGAVDMLTGGVAATNFTSNATTHLNKIQFENMENDKIKHA